MKHYLLIYDRARGARIGRLRVFRDAGNAIDARFAAELQYRGEPDIEIVVLSGRSVDDLRRTHGRYFLRAQRLAKEALKREAQVAS